MFDEWRHPKSSTLRMRYNFNILQFWWNLSIMSMDHFISGKLLNTNCQCCYITFFSHGSTRHHFLLFIWNWIRAGCQKLVNLVCKLDSTNRSPLKRIGNFFVEKLLKCQQNIFGSIYILRILIGRMYACLRWESFFNEETLCAKNGKEMNFKSLMF